MGVSALYYTINTRYTFFRIQGPISSALRGKSLVELRAWAILDRLEYSSCFTTINGTATTLEYHSASTSLQQYTTKKGQHGIRQKHVHMPVIAHGHTVSSRGN